MFKFLRAVFFGLALMVTFYPFAVSAKDFYIDEIKPLFDKRCVGCHSCYNAPCQLKLSSFEGLDRGATKKKVYKSSRLIAQPPSRLFIDQPNAEQWRRRHWMKVGPLYRKYSYGFSPVVNDGADRSILYKLAALRRDNDLPVKGSSEENWSCPNNKKKLGIGETHIDSYLKKKKNGGMPFGLPPLKDDEFATLDAWLADGAKGPGPEAKKKMGEPSSPEGKAILKKWEAFFNAESLKERVVARYIYEHLFLSHIVFKGIPGDFYRLARSKTSCAEGVEEIATRRPYGNPGPNFVNYCFRKYPATIVDKNHVVYRLDDAKMARLKSLFLGNDWEATKFPSWKIKQASNPFITFAEIPARARYQFMLDDALFNLRSFIRGPVCRGPSAVDSIDEQFFVFFLKPDADDSVTDPEFLKEAANLLTLPASRDSNMKELLWRDYKITKARNEYRKLRDRYYGASHSQGYSLDDIWDGGGVNNNAVMTVQRHFDSGSVTQGAVGGIPKTSLILDYPIFERFYYNLVAGFDVYGNIFHQVSTRLYMGLLRMEGEELFLSFLPADKREALRDTWYKGKLFTQWKIHKTYPLLGLDRGTQVRYPLPSTMPGAAFKADFLKQVLNDRLKPQVRGETDSINCCGPVPNRKIANSVSSQKELEEEMRKVTSIAAKDAPYVSQMPDLAFLRVEMGNDDLVYTIIRNKAHFNVAWINGEDKRRDIKADTINIARGFIGSYPNRFFSVSMAKAADFLRAMQAVESGEDYWAFVDAYGFRRSNPEFWEISDWFNARNLKDRPIDGGLFDLNRYAQREKL